MLRSYVHDVRLWATFPFTSAANEFMAESNIITWNPANWITVVLMVALAYFTVGAIIKVYKQRQSAANSNS